MISEHWACARPWRWWRQGVSHCAAAWVRRARCDVAGGRRAVAYVELGPGPFRVQALVVVGMEVGEDVDMPRAGVLEAVHNDDQLCRAP